VTKMAPKTRKPTHGRPAFGNSEGWNAWKKYEYLRTIRVSNTATALVDIIRWYEGMTTKMYTYNKALADKRRRGEAHVERALCPPNVDLKRKPKRATRGGTTVRRKINVASRTNWRRRARDSGEREEDGVPGDEVEETTERLDGVDLSATGDQILDASTYEELRSRGWETETRVASFEEDSDWLDTDDEEIFEGLVDGEYVIL
jgi:hypothetical protein